MGEIFGSHVIAAAVLDRILHYYTMLNMKDDSYRLEKRRRQGFHPYTLQDDFRYYYKIKCTFLIRPICAILHRR